MRKRQTILLACVLLAVVAAYANSFQNGFHFDDFHTIVDNPAIRSLHNAPGFFTDASTFSVLPPNRTYRPFVSLSLALDYALGHGYQPFWFHLSTLLVFLLQLTTMFLLYRRILKLASESNNASTPPNIDLAVLAAVAWYGLHPAMAETVNYIIQRGDIYSTLGVVASLALFASRPNLRRTGLYLLPFLFGILSKPPAIVLPALIFAYVAYFEAPAARRWRRAAIASLPAIAVGIAAMILQSAMTPRTYAPSIISASDYVITQPFVLLRYFASFFLPLHLNVDTDLEPFHSLTPNALYGFLFLAALAVVISLTARRKILRPISFGLLWFFIASVPTSVYRLSEVENDHRMYMPFVGLALAVAWALWLLVERMASMHPHRRRAAAAVAVVALAAYAFGVHQRNRIWRTDESLWLDDIQKSPHNGRGLMNYGLTQMAKGDFPAALDSFTRALAFTPNYPALEINLGVVNGALAQAGDPTRALEAERHFQRAVALSPADDEPPTYYGRWLADQGREPEAIAQLQQAIALNPQRLYPRELLVAAYAREGDTDDAHRAALAGLQLAPGDTALHQALAAPANQDAAYWINLSLAQYQHQQYTQSIDSAHHALALAPRSSEAYNNIGAAYGAMQNWDAAIEAEKKALDLNPKLQIAQNNLRWFSSQKTKPAADAALTPAAKSPGDLLNQSLRLNQSGQFEQSIAAAHAALRLNPQLAEAWNNIAADDASLHRWDQAIAAAQRAIALKTDFQLAKNNLAWALAQKKLQTK